jgi:twitching motility protein PilT
MTEKKHPPINVPDGGTDLATILLHGVDIGASDIHLTVGEAPCYRMHGSIVPTNLPVMDRDSLHVMLYDLLDDDKRRNLERDKELDFALSLGSAGRFRVNCFYTMNGEAAVFRIIPSEIKTFRELGLPPVLMKVATRPRGLVLCTGPTGSGKSTTLAAMVDYVNTTRDEHILTIEDPIEFVHRNKRCIVNQREVGPNTHSFAKALRSALREDPDVILVGEMRDLETISLALTASETGHLVFGTLHTQSAPKTCDRVIDVFPPEQQKLVRMMFAETFEAIICQALLKKANGRGRVLALEIMLGIAATRSLIREGKTHQLPTMIQTSAKLGMQALDQSLKDLLDKRVITEYDALSRANNPDSIMSNGTGKLEEYLEREAKRSIQEERHREMTSMGGMKDLGGMSMAPPPRPVSTPGLPPPPAGVGGGAPKPPGAFPFGPKKR